MPTSSHYSLIFVLIFGLLILSGCARKERNSSAGGNQIRLSKIKLKDMNDRVIDLSNHKGKVIFINFWATWCRPCIEEMPSIKNAKSTLKGKNIEFLVASNEDLDRIQNFATKTKLGLNFVQLENMEELNIQALPTTFIFNAKGELVFSEMGYRKWDEQKNIEVITKIINSHE